MAKAGFYFQLVWDLNRTKKPSILHSPTILNHQCMLVRVGNSFFKEFYQFVHHQGDN